MDMDQPVELRHLRYFVAVAEELNFGRAARRLHIAQPPLSQQIKRLEEMIGYPLFSRTSRAVKLTEAGAAFLERARRTLENVRDDLQSVRAVARGETGSLSIGFVGSAMLTRLPSVLQRYREAYPAVNMRLREQHTVLLAAALRDGSLDVALLRDADPDSDLIIEPAFVEHFLCIVPAKHALARLKRIPAVKLKAEPFVLFSRHAGTTAWNRTAQICEAVGFQPNVVQEAPQWLTIVRLVGAGLGVTIAPACVAQVAAANVVCRPLTPDSGITSVDLAYRRERVPPTVAAFCRLARQTFERR